MRASNNSVCSALLEKSRELPAFNQSVLSLALFMSPGLGGHYTDHNLCHSTYGRQIRAFSPGTEKTASAAHYSSDLPLEPLNTHGLILSLCDAVINLLCDFF